jgi:hypothetical protein
MRCSVMHRQAKAIESSSSLSYLSDRIDGERTVGGYPDFAVRSIRATDRGRHGIAQRRGSGKACGHSCARWTAAARHRKIVRDCRQRRQSLFLDHGRRRAGADLGTRARECGTRRAQHSRRAIGHGRAHGGTDRRRGRRERAASTSRGGAGRGAARAGSRPPLARTGTFHKGTAHSQPGRPAFPVSAPSLPSPRARAESESRPWRSISRSRCTT